MLLSRDVDPNEESPLRYRERAYAFSTNNVEVAEQVLRDRLRELTQLLSAQPKGKFFNLAAFDHEWSGRPRRPPMVTLQFKDWHGEVVVDRPLARARRKSSRPPPRRSSGTDEQDTRLATAFEACQDLFFLESPIEALEFVITLFAQLLPTEQACGYLYDIDDDVFRVVAFTGDGSEVLRGTALSSKTGLIGSAARLVGAVLPVENPASDERYAAETDNPLSIDLRSMLLVPLNHQGRLLGLVQLTNRRKRPFDEADGHLAMYVGDQLAEFLYQARIKAGS